MSTKILQKSNDFLMGALRGDSNEHFLDYFRKVEGFALINLLEEEKKVFWINVYNSLVQYQLGDMTSDKVDKKIFGNKIFEIGGEVLSLDEIEHGILRGNFWKYGLGFLPGGYLNKATKNWKCKLLDPRIHFQLNCGAASCPIIRPLKPESIENELEAGERDYILNESTINEDTKEVILSGLFLFYIKDFGGMKGIKRILKKYFPNKSFKVTFSSFDWSISPKKIK